MPRAVLLTCAWGSIAEPTRVCHDVSLRENEGRDGSRPHRRVPGEHFVGEAAILLTVRAVDEIQHLFNSLGIGTHALGKPARAVEDAIEETARMERARGSIQGTRVLVGDCLQRLPGLRKNDRFTSHRAIPDSRAVFHADHDRVRVTGSDVPVGKRAPRRRTRARTS